MANSGKREPKKFSRFSSLINKTIRFYTFPYELTLSNKSLTIWLQILERVSTTCIYIIFSKNVYRLCALSIHIVSMHYSIHIHMYLHLRKIEISVNWEENALGKRNFWLFAQIKSLFFVLELQMSIAILRNNLI